jgi:hypothetical protein
MAFVTIPDWQSFENQGANIASADIDADGVPELFVLRVDSPGGTPNRAFYRVGHGLAVGNAAGVAWDPWIGNNTVRAGSADLGNNAKGIYTSVVWDPAKNVSDAATFEHPETLFRGDHTVIDLFCCGIPFWRMAGWWQPAARCNTTRTDREGTNFSECRRR